MKTRLMLLLFVVLIPFSSFAGEKEKLAEELSELAETKKIMEQTKIQMQQFQAQMMKQFVIPEKDKQKALEFQDKMLKKIFEEFSWEKMKNEYIQLFADIYTVEELKGIIDFYKSPVGQSMIKKQPELIQRSIKISQAKMQQLIPEMQKMTQEFKESMEKK